MSYQTYQLLDRAAVVAEARSWIGTRFHHAQAVKGSGVDCARLAAAVYTECGAIDPPVIGYYARDWFNHETTERLERAVAECCVSVRVGRPGDLALFRFGHASAHAVIITGWPRIIHADRGQGRVLEDTVEPNGPLARRFVSYWSPRRWHEDEA